MTYKINGTAIALQPTSGMWQDREELDIDGNGHSIYPAVREFELQWDLMSMSEFYQIENFYNNQGTTGTVVSELPCWLSGTYTFFGFTGTVLRDPIVGEYFEQYVKDVSMLIANIRIR